MKILKEEEKMKKQLVILALILMLLYSMFALNITQAQGWLLQWSRVYGGYGHSQFAQPIGDIDEDGVNEIIVGGYETSPAWGKARILSYNAMLDTYVEEHNWYVSGGTYHAPSGCCILDLDGDGDQEFVVSWTYSVADGIHAYDWNGFTLTELDYYACSFVFDVYACDYDGDGYVEVLTANRPTEGTPWHIMAFGWVSGRFVVEATWSLGGYMWECPMIWSGDTNKDGRTEVIACISDGDDATAGTWALSWNAATRQWNAVLVYGGLIAGGTHYGVAVGDVDGDGIPEVGIGNNVELYGAGACLFEWSGTAYAKVWESSWTAEYPIIEAVAIGDADNDGKNEFCVGGGYVHIIEWKGSSYVEESTLTNTIGVLSGVNIGDCDTDGLNELKACDILGFGPGKEWIFKYKKPAYTLAITTTLGGTTNPPKGSYTYTEGSLATVSAIAQAGYKFDHWELDGVNVGSATPISVTMNTNHVLHAVFSVVVKEIQVKTDKKEYALGEPVVISISNTGSQAVALSCSPPYDILDKTGNQVSPGFQLQVILSINPGQTWNYVWDQINVWTKNQAPPGEYKVVVLVLAGELPAIPSATFTIGVGPPAATFPIGSYVIPMDEKQTALTAADTTVYGFVWEILNKGVDLYRIIEPPDVTLFTNAYPGGTIYSGGPILARSADGPIITATLVNFPRVTVHILTKDFASDPNMTLNIIEPTKILVIQGIWGDTDQDLNAMKIPYDIVTTKDVETDPTMLFKYNLVIDDCPGWDGNVPPQVATNFQNFVNNGGEVIFTDISLDDLAMVFPGFVSVVVNQAGTWGVEIHNPPITVPPITAGEFPSQYPATFPTNIKIYTMVAGRIVDRVVAGHEDNVRVWMDSANYGTPANYRILGFYFAWGKGIVEGMAYHPQEQTQAMTGDPWSFVAGTIFFGNKFVHGTPPPPPPDKLHEEWSFKFGPIDYFQTFCPSPAVAELGVNNYNGEPDANLEIVTGTDEWHGTQMWHCFDSTGRREWILPTRCDESRSSVAIEDINFDNDLEIAGGTTSGWLLQVFDHRGSFIWTYYPGYYVFWKSSPVICDVNPAVFGLEVIAATYQDGTVWCFNGVTGNVLWSYPIGALVESSPACKDIDNDGDVEIVIGAADGKLYCLNGRTGVLERTYTTGGSIYSSPALANLDFDVNFEVVFGSCDGRVYCLDGGTFALQWIYQTGASVYSSASIGDVNADGRYDVVIGSNDCNVYCLSASTGTLQWFYGTGGAVISSAALANRGQTGLGIYIASMDKHLYLLDGKGTLTDRFNTGATNGITSSPAVADIDGDRKLEIMFTDWNAIPDNAVTTNIFWCLEDCGSNVSKHVIEWQMFRYDACRTGLYPMPSMLPLAHDVAIIGVATSKVNIPSGETITIDVLVQNQGKSAETFGVSVYCDGTLIGSASVTLSSGASTTKTFIWSATGVSVGFHNLEVKASIVSGETDIVDNNCSVLIQILPTLVHDVAINNVKPSKIFVVAGETISIDVEVENPGDYTENLVVDLRYDDKSIGKSTLTLATKASTTLTFLWPTTGLSKGVYIIKATASVVPGETTTGNNNFMSFVQATVAVHDISIAYVLPAKTVVGQGYGTTISVEVINQGDYSESFDLALYANATITQTKTINLASKYATMITFTLDTTGWTKGNYTIGAYATPALGETDNMDNIFVYGVISVVIPGDVNADGKVSLLDIFIISKAFGSETGHPRYNPNADINGDGKVDLRDIFITAKNFGMTQS